MGLYGDILKYLEERGIRFTRKFIPYFLASFGCHIFNIVNMKADSEGTPLAVYWENQEIPDMRLFILFLAPSGFSKSTFLRHLLKGYFGILSEVVETYFKAYMTEAHLTGSATRTKDGEVKEFKGFLEEHPDAIVGVEEFSTLLAAMKQEHSRGLDSVLLDWATHGEIKKGLSTREIGFKTNATLWAGTQLGKGRVEIHGGMMRRFFIILWMPTIQDEKELVEAVIDAPNMGALDYRMLDSLRTRINNLYERLESVRRIIYSERLNDFFRANMGHNEIPLFRRLALGYNILKEDFKDEVYVDLDMELERLMMTAIQWRRRVYLEINDETGMGTDMIVQVLDKAEKKIMLYEDLAKRLLLYEVSYHETDRYLKELRNQKRVNIYQEVETDRIMVKLIA